MDDGDDILRIKSITYRNTWTRLESKKKLEGLDDEENSKVEDALEIWKFREIRKLGSVKTPMERKSLFL